MVVFPAPLGPSSAKISPRRMSRSMPCRTWVLPYDILKSRTRMTGGADPVEAVAAEAAVAGGGAVARWSSSARLRALVLLP